VSGRVLFTIRCTTCGVLLQVRSEAAIGELLICPKCGCLVKVEPPPGWQGSGEAEGGEASPGFSSPKSPARPAEKAEARSAPVPQHRPDLPQGAGEGKTQDGLIPSPAEESRAKGPTSPGGSPVALSPKGTAQSPFRTSDRGELEAAGSGQVREGPFGPGAEGEAPPAGEQGKIANRGGVSPAVRPARSGQGGDAWAEDRPPVALPTSASYPKENGGKGVPSEVGVATGGGQGSEGTRARSLPGWVLGSLALLPALGFVLAGILLWSHLKPDGEPTNRSLPSTPVGQGESSPSERADSPPKADSVLLSRPWWWEKVLPQTRGLLYVDFRGIPAPQLISLLSQGLGEGGKQGGGGSFSILGIQPEALAEGLWVRKEFTADRPGFFLLRLLPKHTAEGMALRGEAAGLTLGGISFRRDPGASWAFPFGVLDSQTVLTGEPELLEAVFRQQGPPANFESPVFARLWKHVPVDAKAVGLVDLHHLRESGWEEPVWLMDVWPEVAPAWQVLCRIPVGIVGFYRETPTPLLQVGLLCSSTTAASQVGQACATLVEFSQKLLAKMSEEGGGGLEGLFSAKSGEEGQQLAAFVVLAAGAVKGLAWEVVEDCVWLRLGVPTEVGKEPTSWKSWQDNLRRWWLLAGLEVDWLRHEGLQSALSAYRGERGHFPPAAGGAALLPPETRLSWIALLLPQLGLADWHRELQFGYSWNSPQNRPVTQRELQAVINPSLGPNRFAGGFPVTHYVGVAGVGADAPHLPASDPRAGVFGYQRVVRLEDIPDGASHTAAIIGASGRLGPWAAGGPATVRPLTERPYINGPDGFGSGQPHGMLVGMADGSVRFISADIDPVVLEQLAAMGDGAPRDLEFLSLPLAQTLRSPDAGSPSGPPKPSPSGGGDSGLSDPSGVSAQPSQTPAPKHGLGGAGGATPAGGSEPVPADPTATPPPGQQDWPQLVACRLATEIRGFRVPRLAMADAVRALSRLSNVPVSFDLEPMVALGISPNVPVELEVGATDFRQAMEKLASQAGLSVVVDSGHVIITIPEEARTALVTKRYPVGDLLSVRFSPSLQDGKADPGSEGSSSALSWAVRTFVAPETWKEQGGRGTLTLQGTELVVEQTLWIHRGVEKFLADLRSLRQANGGRIHPQTRWATAQKVLSRPVTVNFFQPAPLTRVLRRLEESVEVKLLVNWRALMEAGIAGEPEVALTVHQLPLAQALEQLSLPLGLGYRTVEPTVFELTSRSALNHAMEIGFYEVGELLRAIKKEFGQEVAPEEILLQMLSGEVGGESWAEAGGPARMVVDPVTEHLIVLQSQPVHAELERYLSRLRAEFREGPR